MPRHDRRERRTTEGGGGYRLGMQKFVGLRVKSSPPVAAVGCGNGSSPTDESELQRLTANHSDRGACAPALPLTRWVDGIMTWGGVGGKKDSVSE
jgi:hypothetical protein